MGPQYTRLRELIYLLRTAVPVAVLELSRTQVFRAKTRETAVESRRANVFANGNKGYTDADG